MRIFGGDLAKAWDAFFNVGDITYHLREIITEETAIARIGVYLNGVSPQLVGHSTRYVLDQLEIIEEFHPTFFR